MAGRPTSMTPQVKEKILEAIRGGNYREVAAQYAGVTAKTLREYLRKKDDDAIVFRAAILAAEAKVEIDLVGAIKKLADGDLKAGTWYLARKFPERWAERSAELKEALKILKELRDEQHRDEDN